MEFVVLESENVPAKPVLAVHTGSVRRQVKLEVNQPFVVPHPGSTTAPVEVSVFQQLASQLLPDDGKEEVSCNIPLRKPDGGASQVTLRIRRGVDAPAATAGGGDDTLGMTKEYLDHHHLQQRVQGLLQDVLRDQPQDPYRYMLDVLKKVKKGEATLPPVSTQHETCWKDPEAEAAEQAAQPKEPLVPRPPEKPKPADSRPAPAVGRNLVGGKVEMPNMDEWPECRMAVRMLLSSPRCMEAGKVA
eukprot:TRINITY_DN84971_c0_g1_i1.p1 TRINITY_DN84971_c0_g1~~TRINITY_DN84971_c0_g1_i1.p1  ORF type:complete len:245 (+),score=72.39 TRINITY_DN84971_c0_g1_i1:115-849(+)